MRELREDLMRIIRNFGEFYKLIKPLRFEDFEGLDIVPSTPLGVFFKNRLSDLLEFCKKNPQYHVISQLSYGVELNRPMEVVSTYELGNGDNDPDLMYIKNINLKTFQNLRILKLKIDEF